MTPLRTVVLCILVCLCVHAAGAQVSLHGYVRDAATRERLIGATVAIDGTKRGTTTNAFGFFSLPGGVAPSIRLPDTPASGPKTTPGITLRVSYVGYEPAFIRLPVDQSLDTPLDLDLRQSTIRTGEVVVEADMDRSHTSSTQIGVVSVPMSQIASLPSVGGEVDVLKAIQLQSGVASGQELSNSIFVRGGNFDQNLFLLDGVTVYNPNHLFGFFSVFNTDAIRNVEFLKGGMPAQYGGRLSSVLSFSLNDGNLESTVWKGGVSLIASRLSVEGPLSDDKKGSFLLSARRSYYDQLYFAATKPEEFSPAFYIFDLTAKVNYSFSDDDRVYMSGYFGRDNISITPDEESMADLFNANVRWGNEAYNFRWNRIWSGEFFTNLSIVYSSYTSEQSTHLADLTSHKKPSVKDVSAKIDGEYWMAGGAAVAFGSAFIRHAYDATAGLFENGSETVSIGADELQHYVSADVDVTQRLRLYAGLRVDYFSNGMFLETDPRINLRYSVSDDLSVKASYTRMYQFVHLLSASMVALPGDVYYPATGYLKPEVSRQLSAGVFSSSPMFGVHGVDASLEVYYKSMNNLPMFRQHYTSPSEEKIREEVILGRGWAYGADFQLSKKTGALTGWMSYSYLSAWRQYAEKNHGRAFHPKFDHTHQLSVVIDYSPWRSWRAGVVFVAATGQPVTVPRQEYTMLLYGGSYTGDYVLDYGDIYSSRLHFYNRLDISATYAWTGWGVKWELFTSIYNVYNYPIPFMVSYNGREFSQSSFGFLPTFGVNFKF